MSAILQGLQNFTDADCFDASAGAKGNTAAFGGTLVWKPKTTALSQTRCILSTITTAGGSKGWDVRTTGANATALVTMYDGSGTGRSSGSAVLSAVINRINYFTFVWNGVGNVLRTYLNRAEIGSGTSVTGYTPGGGALKLGAFLAGAGFGASDNDVFGFELFEGLAGLAQVQAQHDAILASDGTIQKMPGCYSAMLVDVTRDVAANSGALPPVLIDRANANNLARTGTPALAPQYARAFGF